MIIFLTTWAIPCLNILVCLRTLSLHTSYLTCEVCYVIAGPEERELWLRFNVCRNSEIVASLKVTIITIDNLASVRVFSRVTFTYWKQRVSFCLSLCDKNTHSEDTYILYDFWWNLGYKSVIMASKTFFFLSFIFCVWMFCLPVSMCPCAPQKKGSDPSELELQMIVRCLIWVFRPEPGSSARAESINCKATRPPSRAQLISF